MFLCDCVVRAFIYYFAAYYGLLVFVRIRILSHHIEAHILICLHTDIYIDIVPIGYSAVSMADSYGIIPWSWENALKGYFLSLDIQIPEDDIQLQ